MSTQLLRPSGIEYVRWAVNWRRGCAHGCRYCYAAAMAHRFGSGPDRWINSKPVVPDPAAALRSQLARKRKPVDGMILVSSSHDPFVPGIGREGAGVIEVLGEFGLWPQTLLLTKSPCAALQALGDMGASPDGLWFGTSLTGWSFSLAARYEPRAERPGERLDALRAAARRGYRVWVSLEPPLPGVRLTALAGLVSSLEPKPWLVLGKMNARSSRDPTLRAWTRSPHWADDRDAAVAILQAAGFRESPTPRRGGFLVKRELNISIGGKHEYQV